MSYFQWRASQAGAEKILSAMLPHAGADSRVFREVVSLGGDLQALGEVVGSRVHADVAVLFDWSAWWAAELDSHPSQEFRYRRHALDAYRELWRSRVTVDVVPTDTDFDGYRVVVVPALYLVDDHTATRLEQFAAAGGTVVVTYFSGIVDPDDHIRLGGYPGAFRNLLGVRVEEFGPLRGEDPVQLDDGGRASRWTEDVETTDAEVVRRFVDGPFPGGPAVTRRSVPGGGTAWYLATTLEGAAAQQFWADVLDGAGVRGATTGDGGLETVVRSHDDGRSYVFAINHGDEAASLEASGTDLLTGREYESGTIAVSPGDVLVLRRS